MCMARQGRRKGRTPLALSLAARKSITCGAPTEFGVIVPSVLMFKHEDSRYER